MTSFRRLIGLGVCVAVILPVPGLASTARELSGPWVMAQLTTTAARIPVLGEVYATSQLVTLHLLRHQREKLEGGGVLCDLQLQSGSRFVRTTLSSAAKARLPAPVFDARLGYDAQGQVTLQQARRFIVVGARLDNPLVDPLPHRATDPTVFDEDRDGHPGMTIDIGGIMSGQIFVAQRSWTELSGTMVGSDGFAGSVRFGNEQVVLHASSPRLAHPPKTRAVPALSWFRMRRLFDGARCADARALSAGWFP